MKVSPGLDFWSWSAVITGSFYHFLTGSNPWGFFAVLLRATWSLLTAAYFGVLDVQQKKTQIRLTNTQMKLLRNQHRKVALIGGINTYVEKWKPGFFLSSWKGCDVSPWWNVFICLEYKSNCWSKNLVSSTNWWSIFHVICLRVAVTVKLGCGCHKTAAKPNRVTLPLVSDDIDIHTRWLNQSSARHLRSIEPIIYNRFQIALKSSSEMIIHCRSTR